MEEIIRTVDALTKRKISFIAVKEGICLDRKKSLQNQVMISTFKLFGELRKETNQRSFSMKKANGKKLGNPKRSLGKSKLYGKNKEIQTID